MRIGLFLNGYFDDISLHVTRTTRHGREDRTATAGSSGDHPDSARTLAVLEDKIEQLEARLNKTPRNSFKPPSSELLHAKPTPRKQHSHLKPGWQP